MRSRLETLKWLYAEAEEALESVTPDRKSALIGQLRGISAEVEEIEGAVGQVPSEMTPLDELMTRRQQKRRSG